MSSEIPVESAPFSRQRVLPGSPKDSLANHLLAYALLGCVLAFLLARYRLIAEVLIADLPELLVWTLLVVLVNLFPVWLGESTFTMDMPLLLALALLYPPEVAAFVAVVASLDVREVLRRVSLSRALFNRAQIAVLVLAAGAIFHRLTHDLESWPATILATLAAIAASFALNVFWVALYSGLRTGRSLPVAVRALTEGRLGEFAATYVGYCGLALVLAYLFRDIGVWSVFLFLAPTLVAQLMLARGRRLQALAEELKRRERLLENLSDRIVDERRDERLRIAADLHDDVLQSLIRISQLGNFLRGETNSPSQAHTDAEEVASLASETLTKLRHVVGDLQQSPLGRGGLVPTLRGLARDLQLVWRTKVIVEAPAQVKLAPEKQVALYQMLKEAMLNALKHAHAREVHVSLQTLNASVIATIRDDGCGFDPEDTDLHSQFGIGLMRERARMIGSGLEISSSVGEGTEVRFDLPELAADYEVVR